MTRVKMSDRLKYYKCELWIICRKDAAQIGNQIRVKCKKSVCQWLHCHSVTFDCQNTLFVSGRSGRQKKKRLNRTPYSLLWLVADVKVNMKRQHVFMFQAAGWTQHARMERQMVKRRSKTSCWSPGFNRSFSPWKESLMIPHESATTSDRKWSVVFLE